MVDKGAMGAMPSQPETFRGALIVAVIAIGGVAGLTIGGGQGLAASPGPASNPAPPSGSAPPSAGSASDPAAHSSADPDALEPDRFEWGAAPFLLFSSDVGIMFGAVASFAQFDEAFYPYRWRLQTVLMASLATSAEGKVFSPTQNIEVRGDFPNLIGRSRLLATISFQMLSNAGYYGLGNAASATVPADYSGPKGRYFQFNRTVFEGVSSLRTPLLSDDTLALTTGVRVYGFGAEIFNDSRMARDVAAAKQETDPVLRGASPYVGAEVTVGLLLDTRDNENNPANGVFAELSVRGGYAGPGDHKLAWGSIYANIRGYIDILGPYLVISGRLLVDVGFGPMPFYEMTRVGGFTTFSAPAGEQGARGLPMGRLAGKAKVLGDLELRTTFYHFSAGSHRFELGAALFTGATRVWADYAQTAKYDVGGPAVYPFVGAGIRFGWGEALIIRGDFGWGLNAGPNGAATSGVYFTANHAF